MDWVPRTRSKKLKKSEDVLLTMCTHPEPSASVHTFAFSGSHRSAVPRISGCGSSRGLGEGGLLRRVDDRLLYAVDLGLSTCMYGSLKREGAGQMRKPL